MIGLNKKILTIRHDDNGKYETSDMPYGVGIERSYYDSLIKNITYSELTESATLYFSKSSGFPRVKLENSKFKRCIKTNKADFVVINPKTIVNRIESTYYVETDTTIITGSYYHFFHRKFDVERDLGIKINNVKTLYYYELTEKRKDLVELLQTSNLKFISDDMLNIAINKTDETLTLDAANMILDMLNASDTDSVELGLKTLTGFNINETPLTISTILLLTHRWYMTNARSNVLVTNMLKQLDIINKSVNGRFPYCLRYIGEIETNDYDKGLAKSLIFEMSKTYIEDFLHNEIEFFKKYNIDVKLEIC
jgi:hypothetical protein